MSPGMTINLQALLDKNTFHFIPKINTLIFLDKLNTIREIFGICKQAQWE
jgi:hypothetical protein